MPSSQRRLNPVRGRLLAFCGAGAFWWLAATPRSASSVFSTSLDGVVPVEGVVSTGGFEGVGFGGSVFGGSGLGGAEG